MFNCLNRASLFLFAYCFLSFISIDAAENALEKIKEIEQQDFESYLTKTKTEDILDYVDALADDIQKDKDAPEERRNAIVKFNILVSTGLMHGIQLHPSSARHKRLCEITVNKVAPYVSDAHVWESHQILNPTGKFYTHPRNNQWRLLKRIYRQVNDPRFFIRHKKIVNKNYNIFIEGDVEKETVLPLANGKLGSYISSSGNKKIIPVPKASYRLEVTSDPASDTIRYTIDGIEKVYTVKGEPLEDFSKIKFLQVDTLEAAYEMELENPNHKGKIAAVNFANAHRIGGAFLGGSNAQEEEICRRSNLYSQLIAYSQVDQKNKEKYAVRGARDSYAAPLHAQETIVSPTVTVYKARDFTNLDEPYTVGIITSAALNLSGRNGDKNSQATINATRQKIRSQIASAVHMKAKVLIVGAFGAGSFANDPLIVSSIYAEELKEFGGYFDTIVFAIISPSSVNNYRIFMEYFQKNTPGVKVYDAPEPGMFFLNVPGGHLDPKYDFDQGADKMKKTIMRQFEK